MAKHGLIAACAPMALALCCAFAPAASASSTLLSGYGGPGEGNQAILGSTLIGGGGGGSTGSGGGGSAPQAVTIEVSPSPAAGAGAGAGGQGAGKNSTHAQGTQRSAASGAPAGAQGATNQAVLSSSSAPALGLSGGDWGYVVLALLVLALTAFVTVLLSRGGNTDGGGPGEIPGG
jgi:hypothetical protein